MTRRIYICSPLSGNIPANMEKAKQHCAWAVKQGVIPMAPHIYFPQFMDDDVPAEREIGMTEGEKWLAACQEVWVFGDVISSGMAGELEYARDHDMIIRFFDDQYNEVG